MIYPDKKHFLRLAKGADRVPLYMECLSDELTPTALLHSQYAQNDACFLLESVEGGESVGRYCLAGFHPYLVARFENDQMTLTKQGRKKTYSTRHPLEEIRKLLNSQKVATLNGLPRFFGGAVGYVGYEMVRRFEKLPARAAADMAVPESFFLFARDIFIFDNVAHTVKIIRLVDTADKSRLTSTYEAAARALKAQVRALPLPQKTLRVLAEPSYFPPRPSAKEKRRFLNGVRQIKKYIAAGDVIQTVLSRRLSTKVKAHPVDIYRALRRVNPSPYMFFLKDGKNHLIGSSPEMLVRLENKDAQTRPIAGTRRRGATEARDRALERELLNDEKEKAEHLMLVDLGRNDLGRVCVPGTVSVPHFMQVERYSHVMHLVSHVKGRLREGQDAFDLFRACFPAGTLTGAPKIRAMEIIDELEPFARGPYGGAVGYFSYNGNMDMAITIRTLLLQGNRAYVQAGAGIVADSVPESEFQETQNKAAAMMAALQAAERD